MKVLISNKEYKIIIFDTFRKKLFSIFRKKDINEVYYLQNSNKTHTYFFKTNIDIIGLNEKNVVIFKYLNTPKNKFIEINNDKLNTNILLLPNNSTRKIRINDVLSFIDEYEV